MRHSRVPYSLRVRDKDRYAKEERGEEGALLARERGKKNSVESNMCEPAEGNPSRHMVTGLLTSAGYPSYVRIDLFPESLPSRAFNG